VSDLAKRWVVAAVGIPVVLGLLYLGGWPLAAPIAVLAALGALEHGRLAARGGVATLQLVEALGSAGFVAAAGLRPTFVGFAPIALGLVVAVTGLALVSALASRAPEQKPLAAVSVTLFGAVYVGLPLAFVLLLYALPAEHGWAAPESAWAGALVVALPLAATWLGDAVAFFAGTAWGHGGLAPTISPNKSWVGVWGGLTGAGVAGGAWFFVAHGSLPGLPFTGPLPAVAIGVVLGIGAILGDLAESLMKRDVGVKDSGTFFPGHGGILDRLDALLLTLPAAYAMLVAMEAVL
jgi:phosphatidate cytidylyltransferase